MKMRKNAIAFHALICRLMINNDIFLYYYFSSCFSLLGDYHKNGMGAPISKEEKIFNAVAIIYEVHSQLTKEEGVQIVEFDRLVDGIKAYLDSCNKGFFEFMKDSDFLATTGKARICAHVLYPELESIYDVSSLGNSASKFLVSLCNDFGFSLQDAINTVNEHLYGGVI